MASYTTTLPDDQIYQKNHDGFWVFAYGSLMWNPNFEFSERHRAVLAGFSRALCVYSWVHRGRPEAPGLVFGLQRCEAKKFAECQGIAFKIPQQTQSRTLEKLRARELVTNVYQECQGQIELKGKSAKRVVEALFYTVVEDHPQYAGTLNHEDLLRCVRQGVGESGHNTDYVLATFDQLVREGINDPTLTRLCAALRG